MTPTKEALKLHPIGEELGLELVTSDGHSITVWMNRTAVSRLAAQMQTWLGGSK